MTKVEKKKESDIIYLDKLPLWCKSVKAASLFRTPRI
jgi:hypothetical protein